MIRSGESLEFSVQLVLPEMPLRALPDVRAVFEPPQLLVALHPERLGLHNSEQRWSFQPRTSVAHLVNSDLDEKQFGATWPFPGARLGFLRYTRQKQRLAFAC
jgi:hypothetical protein